MLPGGSVGLLKASLLLDHLQLDNADQNLGVRILQKAIRTPFKVLCRNAQIEYAPILERIIREKQNLYEGYDINSGIFKISVIFLALNM
jgi:chaperonin GroEL